MKRPRPLFVFSVFCSALVIYASTQATVMASHPAEQTGPSDPLASMRVDHIMVNAQDFDASFAWYRDKLSFEPVVRWTVEGLVDTDLSYLRGGGFLIELVSGPESEATASLPRAGDFAEHFAQRGFTHLCFVVDDVDATLATLNRRGVPTFSPAIDFPALGVRVGFIQDPDGNVIEFKGPLAGNNVVAGEARWLNQTPSP